MEESCSLLPDLLSFLLNSMAGAAQGSEQEEIWNTLNNLLAGDFGQRETRERGGGLALIQNAWLFINFFSSCLTSTPLSLSHTHIYMTQPAPDPSMNHSHQNTLRKVSCCSLFIQGHIGVEDVCISHDSLLLLCSLHNGPKWIWMVWRAYSIMDIIQAALSLNWMSL